MILWGLSAVTTFWEIPRTPQESLKKPRFFHASVGLGGHWEPVFGEQDGRIPEPTGKNEVPFIKEMKA